MNLKHLADEFSNMYEGISEYLSKASQSIKECLKGFDEAKYKVGPLKSFYFKVLMFRRIGTWRKYLIEDLPTDEIEDSSGGETKSQAANPT